MKICEHVRYSKVNLSNLNTVLLFANMAELHIAGHTSKRLHFQLNVYS